MSRTLQNIESSALQEGMTVCLLGQDWVIDTITEHRAIGEIPTGVDCYIVKATSGPGIEVYDANVHVPVGKSLPVYTEEVN